MANFTVTMVRHMISYRTATVTVDAADENAAAGLAKRADLEWIESDAIDEGPTDFEVSLTGSAGSTSWRED